MVSEKNKYLTTGEYILRILKLKEKSENFIKNTYFLLVNKD